MFGIIEAEFTLWCMNTLTEPKMTAPVYFTGSRAAIPQTVFWKMAFAPAAEKHMCQQKEIQKKL